MEDRAADEVDLREARTHTRQDRRQDTTGSKGRSQLSWLAMANDQRDNDVTNRRILEELQGDGRLSLAELGRRVGLSPPAVAERVQRLERDGVITGYHATRRPARARLRAHRRDPHPPRAAPDPQGRRARPRDAGGRRVPPHHRRGLLLHEGHGPRRRAPRGADRPLRRLRPDDDVDRPVLARARSRCAPSSLSYVPFASLGDSFSAFFNAVGDFFDSLAAIQWLSLFLALVAFGIYLTIRARASFNILRAAYPDERIQFRLHLGRLHRRLRLQRGRPRARRRRHPAVPDASRGSRTRATRRWRRASSSSSIFDLCMAVPILRVRVLAGRVPEAAGLLEAAGLRPRVLRLAPALHAVPADRAGDRERSSRSRCCRRACGRSGRACARA